MSNYLAEVYQHQRYKAVAINALSLEPGHHVLDGGSGRGQDVLVIGRIVHPGSVIGIDLNPSMTAQANDLRSMIDTPINVEFVTGDIHQTDFEDNRFDRSRLDRTAQHLQKPLQAIREMTRITKDQGVIVACEPNWPNWRMLVPSAPSSLIDQFRHAFLNAW